MRGEAIPQCDSSNRAALQVPRLLRHPDSMEGKKEK